MMFIIVRITLLFSLFICCLPVINAYSSDTAAVVTSITGQAKKQKKDKSVVPLELLSEISSGDQIISYNGSKIRLIFKNDSHVEVILDAGIIKVFKNNSLVIKGNSSTLKVLPSEQDGKELLSIARYLDKVSGYEIKSFENRKLRSPVGNIANLSPSFIWKKDDEADSYIVKLEDKNRNVLFELDSMICNLSFPRENLPLVPGESYIWTVKSVRDNHVVTVDTAAFQLLSENKLKDLSMMEIKTADKTKTDPDDTTPLILKLSFFLENSMYGEAHKIMGILVDKRPYDKQLNIWYKKLEEL
jgi:hypothetical protein